MNEVGIFTNLSKTLGRCTSVADCPCVGICSCTQWGDNRCRGCGRTATEVRDWNTFSKMERKIINLRNAAENYPIRQLMRGKDVERFEKAAI